MIYHKQVRKMKKTVLTILIAFVIGASLSIITIYTMQNQFTLLENKNTVTAFQVGVYKSKENAEKIMMQYPGSISVQDGDYYRVYVGVAKDKTCEELLESYFLNQKVSVYPKEIEVTKTFYQEINLYESNISKDNIEVLEKMNQEMMKKLEGEIL